MIAELLQYRELLWQMTKRDLLLRYKQAAMGFAWAVFMPLINTIIFTIVFTRVASIDVGLPYPLFAFAGLLAWNFFASSLRFATVSLTSNTSLVTKVYFPREIFPVASVSVALIDTVVASLLLVGIMAYYGVIPGLTILLLPVVIAVHVSFTLACSLVLAMSNLFYRDVKYIQEVIMQVWMFATSVLYPVSLVGGKTAVLMRLNPMTPIIDSYRDVLLFRRVPSTDFWFVALLSVVMLLSAWLMFHRAEFQFAENV